MYIYICIHIYIYIHTNGLCGTNQYDVDWLACAGGGGGGGYQRLELMQV